MWWIEMLVTIVCSFIAFWYGFYKGKETVHKEFAWDCLQEGCDFHICATNADLTLQLADLHLETSHPQGY
jgi:hypothetical protein